MTRSLPPLGQAVLGGALAACGAWWTIRLGRNLLGARRTRRFVRTRGRMLDARFAASHREGVGFDPVLAPRTVVSTFVAEVHYEYEVDGRRHTSTRHGFGRVRGRRWAKAARLRAAAASGDPVDVWYDPADPRTAVLERGYVGGLAGDAATALGSLCVGTALLVAALLAL